MDLIDIIQEKMTEFCFEIIEKPHISLTKTVVLQYHWIQRFINDIKSKLSLIQRFYFNITLQRNRMEWFINYYMLLAL